MDERTIEPRKTMWAVAELTWTNDTGMLNSERIRDVSKDVKRASVPMALDAAGTSVDELLTDATRRQNALTAYEAAQRKPLEDFETHKSKENSRIEEEIEKIRAHYSERIQANLDQVTKREGGAAQLGERDAEREPAHRRGDRTLRHQPAPVKASSLAAAAGAPTSGERSPSPVKGT